MQPMENLIIERTVQTPEVRFLTSGELTLEGISMPDNVNQFYTPLFDWVTLFMAANPNEINIMLWIDYLNTSSTRVLIDFLKHLKSLTNPKTPLKIVWKYESDDDDMLELGEEIALVSGVEFEYQSFN